MHGAHDRCAGVSRKCVDREKIRHSRVEVGQIGKSAAKLDYVRLEHINDRSETPRQPVLIGLEGLLGQRIAGSGGFCNRNSRSLLAIPCVLIAHQTGTR